MSKKKLLVLGIVLGSPLFLSGCFLTDKLGEKAVEEAIESSTNGQVDVDLDDESMTFESDDGESTWTVGEDTELPDGFPGDVYIYKGAEIIIASSHEEENETTYNVSYIIDDKISDIADKYINEMEKDGWKKTSKTEVEELILLSFEKGDDRFASITITEDEDEPRSVVVIGCN